MTARIRWRTLLSNLRQCDTDFRGITVGFDAPHRRVGVDRSGGYGVLSRQVWLRFFYVLSVTIYRDDSPATYWFLMVLQSLIAAFFVVTGVLSLMK